MILVVVGILIPAASLSQPDVTGLLECVESLLAPAYCLSYIPLMQDAGDGVSQ